MRPHEVIDGLGDLRVRLANPMFARVFNSTFESQTGVTELVTGTTWADVLRQLTIDGVYQVTRDMCEIVTQMMPLFDESDTFRMDFAPTYNGFIQFETPIRIQTINDPEGLEVNWIMWGHVGRKGESPNHPVQSSSGNMIAIPFSTGPNQRQRWLDAVKDLPAERRDISKAWLNKTIDQLGQWMFMGVEYITDGMEFSSVLDEHQVARILKALWMLYNQRISVSRKGYMDRAGLKRAKRLDLPNDITVIEHRQLEVIEDPDDDTALPGKEWAYRWMVRGKFQWRACGEHHPGAESYEKGWRVRVYIQPYAKNAHRTDLPWKPIGETVHRFSR